MSTDLEEKKAETCTTEKALEQSSCSQEKANLEAKSDLEVKSDLKAKFGQCSTEKSEASAVTKKSGCCGY